LKVHKAPQDESSCSCVAPAYCAESFLCIGEDRPPVDRFQQIVILSAAVAFSRMANDRERT
jgi:hypothetical protein